MPDDATLDAASSGGRSRPVWDPLLTKTHRSRPRPPFECIALVLQGGGALGAYQAGVYQALVEAELQPDWVAGISIGAINAAIIAGNPPEKGVEMLRSFWQSITAAPPALWWSAWISDLARGDQGRTFIKRLNATAALVWGAPGFFELRLPPPWLHPAGILDATSFYVTNLLRATLERFIDFDRINSSATRLSLGAVNVRSGNLVYFDSTTHTIGPEHVMASGALPPGFPAIEIEGEHYWDGGLVSNTPLGWVVKDDPRRDTLAFQVDLWSARGEFPRDLEEVAMRQKEIQYSSRTRARTDEFKSVQRLRAALADLLQMLPPDLRSRPEAQQLARVADHKAFSLVHLIYRSKHYERHSKDYEFSRLAMQEHWQAGYIDAVRTLRHPEVLERPRAGDVSTFDLAYDGRE
ncbi:patatin-like phospholipase family protein [Falsiroseomonas sp. HW251]|uniref:patatin-like phospholipase family protein n=1 Tax=Falsiroseomonas sp. HW251 TaxID=3390998 RepID=UPI003D312844